MRSLFEKSWGGGVVETEEEEKEQKGKGRPRGIRVIYRRPVLTQDQEGKEKKNLKSTFFTSDSLSMLILLVESSFNYCFVCLYCWTLCHRVVLSRVFNWEEWPYILSYAV
jgi:hypothetical protein